MFISVLCVCLCMPRVLLLGMVQKNFVVMTWTFAIIALQFTKKLFYIWQNFLFATRDEDAPMKVIDFGLSDFIKPGKDH